MKIRIGMKEYEVQPYGLKMWLESEELKYEILGAAKNGLIFELNEKIFSYIEKAISTKISRKLPWYDVAAAFSEIILLNVPKHRFPILFSSPSDTKNAWDYSGRVWYSWAHTLARCYGWDLEYIADLPIDDAVGLTQEGAVEAQLEREWQWSMSELAYSYNEVTKKSDFHALPRPDWMQTTVVERTEKPKKTKILASMLPVGNIVRFDDAELS